MKTVTVVELYRGKDGQVYKRLARCPAKTVRGDRCRNRVWPNHGTRCRRHAL